jgi:hypothetical protein
MANSNRRKITAILTSKKELQLPEMVVDAEGGETSLAMLLVEESFRTKMLESKERRAKEHGERRSAKLLRRDKEEIDRLAEPVSYATEQISLECVVRTVETDEEMSVRFDGFDALTVHYLTEVGGMFLLEGEVRKDLFAVKALTALEMKFGAHIDEQEEDEDEDNGQDGQDAPEDLDAPQEHNESEPEDSPQDASTL